MEAVWEVAAAAKRVAAKRMRALLDEVVAEVKCNSTSCSAGEGVRIRNPSRTALGQFVRLDAHVTLVGGEELPFSLMIGEQCVVRAGCYLSARRGRVTLGENSYVGHNCWIGGQGTIDIGAWALIAPNVVMISSNHDFRRDDIPYGEQREIAGSIEIGRNVWIGAGSVILPDTTIGAGVVVAAGSVVKHDVPPRALIAGAPASVVRMLDEGDLGEL
jgi:acetyltransferase-like isoleucine patch superfamily enzyme